MRDDDERWKKSSSFKWVVSCHEVTFTSVIAPTQHNALWPYTIWPLASVKRRCLFSLDAHVNTSVFCETWGLNLVGKQWEACLRHCRNNGMWLRPPELYFSQTKVLTGDVNNWSFGIFISLWLEASKNVHHWMLYFFPKWMQREMPIMYELRIYVN